MNAHTGRSSGLQLPGGLPYDLLVKTTHHPTISATVASFLGAATIALTTAPSGHAEEEPYSKEKLQEGVAILEQRSASRSARVNRLREQILELDAHIEESIGTILAQLEGTQDSKESRTKVTRTKQDVIAGLKNTIEYYARRRDQWKEQVRTASTPEKAEVQAKAVAVMDERINKRIDQIIKLSESFTVKEDHEKYIESSTSGGYGYGGDWGAWGGPTYEKNEDWSQNRRTTVRSDQERRHISEALEASVEDLSRQIAALEAKLENPGNATDAQLQLARSDLARLQGLVATREEQIENMTVAPSGSPDSSTTVKEAVELDAVIKDTANDLRNDFGELFRQIDEYMGEVEVLRGVNASLEDFRKRLAAAS